MSLTSGFFDAMEQGEGNYDRVYTAAEFAHYFSLLVGNGVFPSPDTGLNVLASNPASMTVEIGDGSGWINGYFVTVNGGHSVTLEAASGAGTRIDSIIMQWNSNDRKINIIAKSGTAGGDPQPVELQRDAELWELELAQITVGAGVSSVVQTKIKDMRADETRCGLVTALLKGIDPSSFLRQSEAEFNQWFETVMNKISDEDVAGSLLKMITEVDNREKEHYTELFEKVDGSLDKASMIKPLNDVYGYKKISIAVKVITNVDSISAGSLSIYDSIWHAKSQRLFLSLYDSSSNTLTLRVQYINKVTNKWSTSSITVNSSAYSRYYRLMFSNGDYTIIQYQYSSSTTLYIYKCTVSSDGSVSLKLHKTISITNMIAKVGLPLEGLSQDITKIMFVYNTNKMVVNVETGSIETFTTPTTYTYGSLNDGYINTFLLSDGSIVCSYSSGIGIITPDKKEHLFPTRTLYGQGCIDPSGKYIYLSGQSNYLVISRDTYEIVKTISTDSPSGIFKFGDSLYNSNLQVYLNDTFDKVSALTYVSAGSDFDFYIIDSNVNKAALTLNPKKDTNGRYPTSGAANINGLILTKGSSSESTSLFIPTDKTTTKCFVTMEE